MAKTLSIFVAGAALLIAVACMATSHKQSLFYDVSVTAPVDHAQAEPAPSA